MTGLPEHRFNFDVWEHIVEAVGPNHKSCFGRKCHTTTTNTLRALSLTCKAMVPLCQKRLFSSITLAANEPERSARFEHVMSTNPLVVGYVRVLACFISNSSNDHMHGILEVLKNKALRLSHIHMHPVYKTHQPDTIPKIIWDTLPEASRLLLQQLIQLPSVTLFGISNTKQLSPTIFDSTNLTHLSLLCVEFASPRDFPESTKLIDDRLIMHPIFLGETQCKLPVICLMQPRGPSSVYRPFVDFTALQDLRCDILDREDAEMICYILRTTLDLQILSLRIGPENISLEGLGEALSTLKLRKLMIWRENIVDSSVDPLSGVVDQLHIISRVNILEEIELRLAFHVQQLARVVTEALATFDAAVTASGSFPCLKRVGVDIKWNFITGAEVIVQGVTVNHFPGLLSSDAIELDAISSITYWCDGPCQNPAAVPLE